MISMYIDESGSIHHTKENLNRYFIVGIVIPKDSKKLRKVYKNFVRKYIDELRSLDTEFRMFDKDGHFLELKGSCMNKPMKLNFINYFCRNNLFEVRYIILDNNHLENRFIKNKARTFNYLIKIFLINSIKKRYILDKELFLQIIENVQVQYFDSSQNCFIQIADVFSNLMYSNLITREGYQKEFEWLQQNNYVLPPFIFPKQKFENKIKKI